MRRAWRCAICSCWRQVAQLLCAVASPMSSCTPRVCDVVVCLNEVRVATRVMCLTHVVAIQLRAYGKTYHHVCITVRGGWGVGRPSTDRITHDPVHVLGRRVVGNISAKYRPLTWRWPTQIRQQDLSEDWGPHVLCMEVSPVVLATPSAMHCSTFAMSSA